MAETVLREATERDIGEILEVLKAALGEPPLLRRTRELYDWKHVRNPFGQSIVLVAEAFGGIVGVRALMRWELADANGCPVKCVRAVDTATHPEFQGKGIFRSLTLAAVEEARSRGIDLIFNTPNEKSAPGYFKMGWREVGWLRPLIRPRIGPTAKLSPNGPPDLAQVLPIAGPVLDLESPGDREFFGLRTPRTTAYYQWRFAGHPAARYGWVASEREPGGAVVRCGVRSGRTELTVSELTAGADCLRRIARKHHARYMAGVFGGGSPERRAALNAAMFPVPGVGLRLVANPLTELGVDIFDRTNWDLAMSDVELL